MRRIPVYVFENLNSLGIYNVPLESMVQINDSDGNGTPIVIQLLSKDGLTPSSTIGDLLQQENNFINTTADTEIPSELEKIEQNGKIGWRILGRNPANFAPIGQDAIDLSNPSFAGSGQSPYGASGNNSLAEGVNTQARGEISHAAGWGTIADSKASFALGQYNVGLPGTIFEIGVGSNDSDRKNAVEVYKTGVVQTPLNTPLVIDNGGDSVVITKEWASGKLDEKYDKTGGLISGNTEISGNLIVHGQSTFNGSVDIQQISSDVEISGHLKSDQDLLVNQDIYTLSSINIGTSGSKSIITFTDPNDPTKPRLYWESTAGQRDFYVDTLNSAANKVWHAGNFDPDSKLNVTGGNIATDLDIGGNLSVGGILSVTDIDTNVTFQGNIDAQNANIQEELTTKKIKIGIDNNQSSITFSDSSATPRIYWNTVNKLFEVDTDTQGQLTLWHAGTFDPNSKINVSEKAQANGVATLDANGVVPGTQLPPESVTSVNGYSYANGNADVVLTTTDIAEGTNLYYTETRVNDAITSRINDAAGTGVTDKMWSADKLTQEFNTKLDKSGGDIQNDLSVGGDLTVQGVAVLNSAIDLSGNGSILGSTTFTEDANFQKNILVKENLQVDGKIALGLDGNGNSVLEFIDAEDLNASFKPSIYWKSNVNEFQVDTDATTGATLWHSGNFIPGSKLNVSGGTITGSLTVQDDLHVQHNLILEGNFTENAHFNKNLVIDLDANIGGQVTAGGEIRTGIATNGVDSVIAFTDNNDPNALPAIYWNGTDKEFNVDTLDGVGYKLYHEGNISSIVSSVNSKTGDVVLTTTDINEGTNLYYTDARVDNRIRENSINNLADVNITTVSDGQVLKWDANNSVWTAGDDINSVISVNNKTGEVTLNTDDISEGVVNLYYTDVRADARVQAAIDDNSTSGDTSKLWSADKITSELSLKYDKAGGQIDGNVKITGTLVVDSGSQLKGSTQLEHVTTDVQFDQDIDVFGKGYFHESGNIGTYLKLGILSPNDAKIIFTDSDDPTAVPSIYWDQTDKDFKINTDVNGNLLIWSQNNFDPESKFDKTGGEITGWVKIDQTLYVYSDSTLNGNLHVGSNAIIDGNLSVDYITSEVNFNDNVSVDGNAVFSQQVVVGDYIKVGNNNSGTTANSKIVFTDSDDNLAMPGINWNNQNKVFTVDTTSGTNFLLWHSGTFDPDTKINVSEKAQANGVATLDANGKVPSAQLPAIAITDVYVVDTLQDRDNLTGIETGDVCKVIDSDGQGRPQTYIYDGTQWVDIQETSDVMSVNNKTGDVVLVTDDINEGTTNLYYTNARADARVQAAIDDNASTGDTDKLWSADKIKTSITTAVTTIPLNQLTDVDTTGVSDGKVLKWRASDSKWVVADDIAPVASVNGYTGVVSLTTGDIAEGSNLYYTDARVDARIQAASINDLVDVDTAGVTDGQVIKWDSANSKWVPADDIDTTYSAGTGISIDVSNTVSLNAGIDNLNDVDTTGVTDSQLIKWDSASGKWIPYTLPQDQKADFDATANQTDFVVTGAVFSEADVYVNGVLQRDNTYTISDDGTDTTVTFNTALAGGEWVCIKYKQ